MRSPVRQRLLERASELALLDAVLAQAASGEGRLVVIEAAAGLGKTRLIESALEHPNRHGVRALLARGSDLEREYPFGVVRQLLESPVAAAGEQEQDRLFAGAAALARPILLGGEVGTSSSEASYGTLHGLYWLVSTLAADRPLALVVDDAHWADTPSLRFLDFLLPRLAELPVALLLAVRTAESGAERPELVKLAAAPQALGVSPRPLTVTAVEALLAVALESEPAPEFAEACCAATAGNPFYLSALSHELRTRRIEPTAAHAPAVRRLGPRAVSRSVLLRLSSLAPEAPALARAAAVLGDGTTLGEVAHLAELEVSRAAAVADLLVQGAVLKRRVHLEFVHPIVREAVYADFAPQERARQHLLAARALAAAGAPSERIAAQLLSASPADDPWVVDRLRDAARKASANGAFEVAVRYLRRALAEPPDRARRPQLLLELGSAGTAAGEPDSLQRLQEAFELADDPAVQAGAAFEMGRALLYFGRPVEAVAVLERALDRLAGAPDQLRRTLEVLLLMQVHSTTQARRLVVDRLREEARRAERGEELPSEVLATLALDIAQNAGPAERAAPLAVRSLADGRLIEELAGESPALYFATCALTVCDRGDLAEQHFDRTIAVARSRGAARGFAFASCCRGWTRYRRGFLAGAEADLEAFVRLAVELSIGILHPLGLGALVSVRLHAEGPDAAAATLHAADDTSWDRESELFQLLRVARGHLLLAQGKAADALAEAHAVACWEPEYGAQHDAWTRWRELAALATAALGEREEAASIAADAVERARRFGAPDYLGIALHAAGVAAARADELPMLAEAASVLERSHARLEHARALIDLGAALRRNNRRSEAREPLRAGLARARECGASQLVTRAITELQATGARPRRELRTGPAALTPSERRIAEMAAEGLSNPQIAQALFISLKTVQTHLGHAYQKLGIHSRSRLAALLVER